MSDQEKKPPLSKTMPLTTEEPVRRSWLTDQLKDINEIDSTESPNPTEKQDSSSSLKATTNVPIIVTPPLKNQDDSNSNNNEDDDDDDDDDASQDTDMENELHSDDHDSVDSEPTVVSPTTKSPTTIISPSTSKTTTATDTSTAHRQDNVPRQYLRQGSSQMDLLWNEMEERQWDNDDDGFSSSSDDDASDDELKKVTEANRHIDVVTNDTMIDKPDPVLRDLLVFADSPVVEKELDRQCMTMTYGAGPHGNQVLDDDDHIQTVGRDDRTRRHYLIACDFSRESLHAMEWTMGTMLRDHDALHIVTVANREDNQEIVNQSGSSLENDIETSLNAVVDEAKKRMSRMMLYDIKLVCYSMVGRVKDVLKHLIRTLPLTMVVCGSRGRGTMKGLLMGSVSTYLVHKSVVPVAVIRPQKKKKKEPRHTIMATPLSESVKTGQLHADELD
ncbi:hypothetical protein BC941DRAFT_507818 [Chlamydoabsidia padenii]|nr:hypothetical protein BC941DRAFT_507818 [Chlamydoabsidia padenii]